MSEIKFPCKGKLLLSNEEQAEIFDVERRVLEGYPAARGEALALLAELSDRFKVSIAKKSFAALSTVEEVAQALTWFARIREKHIHKPCGYDLTELALEANAAGVPTPYVCPRCGNTGVFGARPEE